MLTAKGIKKKLRFQIGDLLIKAGFGTYILPLYKYHFTPQQLFEMCNHLKATKEVEGDIIEIGCSTGNTTIFLNKFMNSEKMEKLYWCIDTFSGFTNTDKKIEEKERNKSDNYNYSFIMNKKEWFEETMKNNRIKRVKVIQADICDYSIDVTSNFSFAFLDVDLYRPSKIALQKIYPRLNTNGIILVDDCKPSNKWDGALQAYKEFTKENNMEEKYILDKLGVIIKSK